ncbi:MAG: putative rane protein [Deltaproteobacteria bacterium]|nr:putative rane protein [Deltaproteobacteria bacterium]
MKKPFVVFVVTSVLVFLFTHPAVPAPLPITKGGVLPAMNLPIPKSPEERGYLGLSGSGPFKIPQIKAKAVIIEIFSMYCPYCQKDAPGINELYQAIEGNPELKDKIKLIGIGAGNTPYEVGVFKKTYNVPFPLFADGDFTIHKMLGDVRTPYFIVVKVNDDGTHQVVHSEVGGFTGPQPFLEMVLSATGLK